MLNEEWHADANAEKGLPIGDDIVDSVGKTECENAPHAVAGIADAGQDGGVATTYFIRITRDDRFGAGCFKRAPDRTQVPSTIVDDRDHASTPFVDGIREGSPVIRVADRSASAPALKIASAAWCELRARRRSICIVK